MAREMGFDSGKSNETYINVISSITGSAASQVDGVVSVTYGSGKSDSKNRKNKNKAIDVVIYDNRLAKIEIFCQHILRIRNTCGSLQIARKNQTGNRKINFL